MFQPMITPSMMCADIGALRETLAVFERCGIEYLHIDVMDGEFVPNLQLGTAYVRQLRRLSRIPLDLHLMIERPEDKLEWFDLQPGEICSIHAESTRHVQRALARVRDKGARPFLALNPATPLSAAEEVVPDLEGLLLMTVNPGYAGQTLIPQTLDKIRRASERFGLPVMADGNVSFEHAAAMRRAGTSLFVAGSSSVFAPGDLGANIERLRALIAD